MRGGGGREVRGDRAGCHTIRLLDVSADVFGRMQSAWLNICIREYSEKAEGVGSEMVRLFVWLRRPLVPLVVQARLSHEILEEGEKRVRKREGKKVGPNRAERLHDAVIWTWTDRGRQGIRVLGR